MDLTTMEDACASTGRIIERLQPGQYPSPTPCSEWDVLALLNHIVGTLHLGAALLAGSTPSVAMAPGGLPATDLVGDDAVKAYRQGVEALLASASGGALDRVHRTPLGEMPGTVLGGFTTLDVLVHGWDLAKATHQETALDDHLVDQVLTFARQTLADDAARGGRIAPAVSVPDDAPPTSRLVAFLGREP
jgi:uncharacterized protein (TIGR03086 family)